MSVPSFASRAEGAAHERTALTTFFRNNALSLVLAGLFVLTTAGQVWTGLAAYNDDRALLDAPPVSLPTYLRSGHFIEALFENWESEFLQMGAFVLLSVKLRQKGSAESNPMDEPAESDEDPSAHRGDPNAPWPVRHGGMILTLYENSLAVAFFGLFAFAFAMHAVGGFLQDNEERLLHGKPPLSLLEFVASSQFWFESFQNWQSEFLAVLAIVVFTIFLRQRGSPQSKAVAAPHSETGG
jgi:hypothetical protein